jgi:hypothetical protein
MQQTFTIPAAAAAANRKPPVALRLPLDSGPSVTEIWVTVLMVVVCGLVVVMVSVAVCGDVVVRVEGRLLVLFEVDVVPEVVSVKVVLLEPELLVAVSVRVLVVVVGTMLTVLHNMELAPLSV